ncbi:MAG: hypothetical protein ACXACA_02310, partial [Candidatus Ranarchaeia archaeon]
MTRKRYPVIVFTLLSIVVLGIFSTFLTSNPTLDGITPPESLPPTPLLQGGGPTYVWWNGDWRYRTFIEINATNHQLINTTIPITINFTAELEYIGVGGTFDEDSIRVIEQNQTSGEVLHELPSRFFKFANYSATDNAQGIVIFKLNGTTALDTKRSIFFYFDTTDGVPKTPPSYSSYVNA